MTGPPEDQWLVGAECIVPEGRKLSSQVARRTDCLEELVPSVRRAPLGWPSESNSMEALVVLPFFSLPRKRGVRVCGGLGLTYPEEVK